MINKLYIKEEIVKQLINELTRKDILKGIDGKFIHHNKHSADLKSKIGKASIDSSKWYLDTIKGGTLTFKITSAKPKGHYKNQKGKHGGKDQYDNILSFADEFSWLRNNFDFKQYGIQTEPGRKRLVQDINWYFRNMLGTGDVTIGCNCPAYLYFYKYQSTQLDYQDRKSKENRFPIIKNPGLKGTICKHLAVTLKNIALQPTKEIIVEYLTDSFLSQQATRRYHTFTKQNEFWWMDYFKHLNKSGEKE